MDFRNQTEPSNGFHNKPASLAVVEKLRNEISILEKASDRERKRSIHLPPIANKPLNRDAMLNHIPQVIAENKAEQENYISHSSLDNSQRPRLQGPPLKSSPVSQNGSNRNLNLRVDSNLRKEAQPAELAPTPISPMFQNRSYQTNPSNNGLFSKLNIFGRGKKEDGQDSRSTVDSHSRDKLSLADTQNHTNKLAPGWEEAFTKTGKSYYIDHVTKTTTWTDPRLLGPKTVYRTKDLHGNVKETTLEERSQLMAILEGGYLFILHIFAHFI